jgi:serpin B
LVAARVAHTIILMRAVPVVLAALAVTPPTAAAEPLKEVVMREGDSAFATQLHQRLRAQAGNLFYSPASVRIALAMAFEGARGDTRAALERALVLPAGTRVAADFGALLRAWGALADPPDVSDAARRPSDPEMQRYYEDQREQRRVVLRVVNRVWAQRGHSFQKDFLGVLWDQYLAPLGEVDFQHAAEQARAAINEWVSDKTEYKIRELLGRDAVGPDTRMVLTNAVYFKARWSEQFHEAATRTESFFVTASHTVRAPLMHQIGHFSLGHIEGGQILELAYGTGQLVMDVLLPAQKDGLAGLEEQYAGGALDKWLAALGSERVEVFLPRWKSGSTFDLSRALGELGLEQAFTYKEADFSGIDGTRELFIGAVAHQAVVEVDEKGTEAAAATAIALAGGAAQITEPAVFRADHPFLYVIRDPRHGVVLFAGRLVDPTAG